MSSRRHPPQKFLKSLQLYSYMESTFQNNRWNIATAATLYHWPSQVAQLLGPLLKLNSNAITLHTNNNVQIKHNQYQQMNGIWQGVRAEHLVRGSSAVEDNSLAPATSRTSRSRPHDSPHPWQQPNNDIHCTMIWNMRWPENAHLYHSLPLSTNGGSKNQIPCNVRLTIPTMLSTKCIQIHWPKQSHWLYTVKNTIKLGAHSPAVGRAMRHFPQFTDTGPST